MGQTFSNGATEVELISAFEPFDNLSLEQVERVWNNFYDVAGGFAIDDKQLVQIMDVLAPHGVTPDVTAELYRAFDTQNNGFIDAMEVLIALTMTSSVMHENKVSLVFDCYDMSAGRKYRIPLSPFCCSYSCQNHP